MATKLDKELAYEAGRNVLTEPSERRSVDACPFPVGSDERVEWLRGFEDALDEAGDVRSALKAARKEAEQDA